MRVMRSLGRLLAAALLLVSLGSCEAPSVFEPERVDSHEEAGSTHVAVLSVAHWDEVRDAMSPGFVMDGARALAEVLPVSMSLTGTDVNSVSAAVRARPPEISGTTETTDTTGVDDDGEDTQSRTDTAKSTIGADFVAPTAPLAAPSTQTSVAATRGAAGAVPTGTDALLRYQAATALFQEVQLLNRYTQSAAIREDYQPYVVRLQVSVLPHLRNAPYDTYSTLSFFMPGEYAEPPVIVPLLVTDSLERALRAQSADQVRQLSLAAAALQGGVPTEADLAVFDEKLRTVLGQDFNSLLTVARVSDNTIRVRLGAMHQGSSKYALTARTHNITVLLLAKKHWDYGENPPPDVKPQPVNARVFVHSEFRDAETGEVLPWTNPGQMAELRRVVREYTRPEAYAELETFGALDDLIQALLFHVNGGEFESFERLVRGRLPSPDAEAEDLRARYLTAKAHYEAACRACAKAKRGSDAHAKAMNAKRVHADSLRELRTVLGTVPQPAPRRTPQWLWLQMSLHVDGSQYARATVELPHPISVDLPKPGPFRVLVDDGREAAQVRLSGGRLLTAEELGARLDITRGDEVRRLPATQLRVDADRRSLTITFPSLERLAFADGGHLSGDGTTICLCVTRTYDGGSKTDATYDLVYTRLRPPGGDAAATAKELATLHSTHVVAKGDLVLRLSRALPEGFHKLALELQPDGQPQERVTLSATPKYGKDATLAFSLGELKAPFDRPLRVVAELLLTPRPGADPQRVLGGSRKTFIYFHAAASAALTPDATKIEVTIPDEGARTVKPPSIVLTAQTPLLSEAHPWFQPGAKGLQLRLTVAGQKPLLLAVRYDAGTAPVVPVDAIDWKSVPQFPEKGETRKFSAALVPGSDAGDRAIPVSDISIEHK
jgi:hypothetical protein